MFHHLAVVATAVHRLAAVATNTPNGLAGTFYWQGSEGLNVNDGSLSRRAVLGALSAVGLTSPVFARALLAQKTEDGQITAEMIRQAEWIADLELTDEQRQKLAENLQRNRREAARLRETPCDADVPPASVFRPDFFCEPDASVRVQSQRTPAKPAAPIQRLDRPAKALPSTKTEIAFASLIDQAAWLGYR